MTSSYHGNAPHLQGHTVHTVHQQGWDGMKNGDLINRAAAAGFEAFLTSDQNLEFQQNLQRVELCVVLLVATSNKLEDLLPLVPSVLAALKRCKPRRLIRVGD